MGQVKYRCVWTIKDTEVIGVDLSKNMLEIAEKKAQGRPIEWLQADMRVLEDVPTTDACDTLFRFALLFNGL